MAVPSGMVTAIVGSSGGHGYQSGDVLSIPGGNNNATVTVTSIGGGGVVTGEGVANPGTNYISAQNAAVGGGHGTGALVTITSQGDWNGIFTVTAAANTTGPNTFCAAPAGYGLGGGWVKV